MRERTFGHYCAVYFLSVISFFAFISLVNWWVDPFNELGKNKIGLYFSTERQEHKKILEIEHDAVLLGSSRINRISVTNLHGYHFYNAAFSNALPEEIYLFLKKYLRNEKLVVIGLDFFVFNKTAFPVLELQDWPDHFYGVFEYLTSLNVFKSSLIALCKYYKVIDNKPVPQVQENFVKYDIYGQNLEFKTEDPYFNKSCDIFYSHLAHYYFRRFVLSEERLNYYQKIKELLEERKVKYIVFFNPESTETERLYKFTGTYTKFLWWKKEVKRIFPSVKDFSTGQYTASRYYFPEDAFHFKAEVGENIINELTGSKQ